MHNRITLIGTLADHPQEMYDTEANRYVHISLKVPPPPDAPLTHWGGIYDLRNPDWPRSDDTFLIICRDSLLVETCLKSLHKGDLVCIKGRLVPLAKILASTALLLKELAEKR